MSFWRVSVSGDEQVLRAFEQGDWDEDTALDGAVVSTTHLADTLTAAGQVSAAIGATAADNVSVPSAAPSSDDEGFSESQAQGARRLAVKDANAPTQAATKSSCHIAARGTHAVQQGGILLRAVSAQGAAGDGARQGTFHGDLAEGAAGPNHGITQALPHGDLAHDEEPDGFSAVLLVEVLQQLGVDADGAVPLDRWRQLPPEPRHQLLRQLELGQHSALLSEAGRDDELAAAILASEGDRGESRSATASVGDVNGGAAQHTEARARAPATQHAHSAAARDGIMYRRPSYAEDLLMCVRS